jgi:hypothetical protein
MADHKTHQNANTPSAAARWSLGKGIRATIMLNNTANTNAIYATAIFGSYEHPMLLQPVDMVPQDEDDEVMDSWLASLGPREFERILSDLANNDLDGRFALEPTA